MGRIEARPALLAALLAASASIVGCGRTPAPATPNNAAAPELAPSEEEQITLVVAPGDDDSPLPLPLLEQREYDEARSFGVREVLPPPAPAAQVPLRSSLDISER